MHERLKLLPTIKISPNVIIATVIIIELLSIRPWNLLSEVVFIVLIFPCLFVVVLFLFIEEVNYLSKKLKKKAVLNMKKFPGMGRRLKKSKKPRDNTTRDSVVLTAFVFFLVSAIAVLYIELWNANGAFLPRNWLGFSNLETIFVVCMVLSVIVGIKVAGSKSY